MSSFAKEFLLLAAGGIAGLYGTLLFSHPSSSTKFIGFLSGAVWLRGLEYELEREVRRGIRPSENKRMMYSYMAGAGSVSLGIAAAMIEKKLPFV